MFEEILIRHCSPTLAGLKTGSMFVFRYDSPEKLENLMNDYNSRLSRRGVRLTLLRKSDSSALIYVYRPDRLREDLRDNLAEEILLRSGYQSLEPQGCLEELKNRLGKEEDFPHEVGLFLGYPPEDVHGFIRHRGACSKCSGCWKVYGDVEKSQRCFERFRKCRRIFYRQWRMGHSVESLTVPAC